MKGNFKKYVLIKIFNTLNKMIILTVIQKNHRNCVIVRILHFKDKIVIRLNIYNQEVGFIDICDSIYAKTPNDFEDLMK